MLKLLLNNIELLNKFKVSKTSFKNLMWYYLGVIFKGFKYFSYFCVVFIAIYSIIVLLFLIFFIAFYLMQSFTVSLVYDYEVFSIVFLFLIIVIIFSFFLPFKIRILLFLLMILPFNFYLFDCVLTYYNTRLQYCDTFFCFFGYIKIQHLYNIQEKFDFINTILQQNGWTYTVTQKDTIFLDIVFCESIQDIKDRVNFLLKILTPSGHKLLILWHLFCGYKYYVPIDLFEILNFINPIETSVDLVLSDPFSKTVETFFTDNVFNGFPLINTIFIILFKIGQILFKIFKYIYGFVF